MAFILIMEMNAHMEQEIQVLCMLRLRDQEPVMNIHYQIIIEILIIL